MSNDVQYFIYLVLDVVLDMIINVHSNKYIKIDKCIALFIFMPLLGLKGPLGASSNGIVLPICLLVYH